MIWSDACDVNVVVPVVVVITYRYSDTVHLYAQSGLACDISERAVLIIVIERKKRLRPFLFRPIHGINKDYVLPTIVVVVDESASCTDRFGQILLTERPAIMLEANYGLCADVSKLD